ncbi:LOW QUALITY PROTEIN: titin-like [Drosophila sulfurigaster albostrigata]|uniref:LOW QUALITY PROTEIN: titin-like n=1 Tax=Drosophila sulfurigaster albostrigata TaxID=89887 RepID=UPI002D21DB92|nr:LOW QUALITY PROTEIN: titin-like [Drosophila sulfurigaster albostrigata]
MRELDDILNETASYGDRLNEFLKLKTTNKPQSRNTPFTLTWRNCHKKPQPKDAEQNSKEIKKNALRDSTNNANTAILQSPPVVEAPASPLFSENAQPSRSLSNSPKRNLRRSGGIPGSDRLRRVAIQRRSRSCGRDLLKEFNDAEPRTSNTQQQEETSSASNTLNFIPGISSTPAIDAQAKNSTAASAVAVATEQEEQVGVSFKYSQRREEVPLSSTSQRAANANNGTVQRTYTVEMGPEPGQLLLSPSRKNSNSRLHLSPSHSVHNASHRLSNRTYATSPARAEILAPDTPPRVLAHSLRESEFTVPETQPHDGIQQQVLQTMTNSPKAAPFVVIPLACLSPKTQNSIKDQQQSAATSSSPRAASSAAVPKVASRSMQTSDNSRNMKYLNALLTDDDSDDQRELSSLLPLNLAPPGGNTTRQSRLRKRGQRAKSPNMLLDLQTSRTQRQKPLKKSVLNKPSKRPINGEEFAEELARMSNYEILDLRKRNSLGKLIPLNGQRQNPKEQQIIEEHIKWELMRRDRDNVSPKKSLSKVPLPTASPCAKSPIPKSLTTPISKPTTNPSFRMSPAVAPAGIRDRSMRERRRLRRESEKNALGNDSLDSSPENAYQQISKQQRKRSRRRKSSVSEDEILAICTPPAQFRRSKHKQKEEPSTTSLAEPLADFRRSKSTVQLPDSPTQLRKSMSRHTEETNKTVVAEPPPDFRYRSRQRIEDDHSDEDALPQPTAQLRKSKSLHLEQLKTNETVLPEPPEQFRKSRYVEQESEGVSNTSPLQESRIYRSRLRIQDNESPPLKQSVQLRKSKSRHLEQLDIIESNETVISENPQQMRLSKSRRFEQLDIVESNGHCERSKITHLEMHTEEVSALPEPPEEYKRHKSRLRIEDDESDEAAPPMPASPVQLQKPKSNDKKKHITIQRIEDDDSDEAAMPDPPTQLLKSKAKHLEQNNIVESYETVLADPPEQFKSPSRVKDISREEVMPPSLPIETDLDEMPSTSNNTGSNRRRGRKKKASNNDVKIKKKEAAVSREKQSRRVEEAKKELSNLAINLPNRTLPPSEHDDDQNTTGVRKSKRGHIPLCNTWVHTMDDPFFFLFKKPYQRKVYPLPPKPKKKLHINNTDLFVDKPPLASSTPSNEATNATSSDTKAEKQNRKRKQLTGITLSSIAEQPEERSMELEIKTSKRGRPKKYDPISSKDIDTPKTFVSSASQTDFEPALECHPTVQSTNSPQNDGFPLNWLRNLNDQPIPKDNSTHQEFKSMKISRASNLQYSKINGLDYAFYGGSDNTIGFIRFQPFQVRGINKAKSKLTNETVLPEPLEQFRKSRYVEQESEGVSNTSLLQESRIYKSRLRIRDNESPSLEQSVQLRKSKSRHLEQLDIIESNETVISENPQQMRMSKSRRFEQLDIVESNGHCERSKITHLEMHTEEVSALPEPPEEYKRHKSRLRIEDDESDEAAPPMPASPVQLQKPKSNDKKKHITIQRIEDDDSDEAAMPDPPTQLLKSKAKHLEQNNIVESYETVLADPPEQFRKSKSRQRHVTIVEPDTSDMENTQPQLQRSMTQQREQLVALKSNIDGMEMPSLQCVDEVRSNDVDTGAEAIINSPPKPFNNNTSHISSREEVMPPSLPIETDLDEMPSTSNNTGSNRRRGRKKASNNDGKIKKKEAAVSREKQSRRVEEAKKELSNLAINLPNRTLPPSEHDDDQNTTGVRKSKRGHIPLCNTWVHTMDDPFFFLFKKPYQRKVYPLPPKPKKKLHINNTDLFVDKPPLASSTPSNEATNATSSDTKAEKQNRKRKQLTGITLSSIAEQPEERSMELEIKTSKRGRPKKYDPISSKDIDTPKTFVSSASQTDFEPALECHPTVQSTNSPQNDGFPLNWLRNLNDQPIPKDNSTHPEFKSMKISRASNLQYSKINGLDYAFYGGSDNTIGFIRFQPFQVRGINKAKSKLQFVVFYGEFEIETNDLETKKDPKTNELLPTRDTISAGDFLLIKIGTQYNIKNCLDAEGVLLINRCS